MNTDLKITLTCIYVIHVTQSRNDGKIIERDFTRPLRIQGTPAAVAQALPAETADLVNSILGELGAADQRAQKGYQYRFPLLLPLPDSAAPLPPPIPAMTAAQLDEYNRTMGERKSE